jgi:hypothetical protein
VAARASGHLRSAQCAIDANSGAIDEIIRQQADLRSRLVALEGQIAAEAAVVLVAEVDGKLAEVKAAADSLNLKIAAVMGLHSFLHRNGGAGFPQLAWQISQQMKTPDLGATRSEILAAEAEWAAKFDGLTA